MASNKFLYFAYGSNLLAKRIRINNPTAVRRDIGRLKDFRLDFATYSKRWHGASATIVPTENEYVWGAIWEIDNSDIASLDQQEGVEDKLYFSKIVDIETPNGSFLKCKVYQQCNNPQEHLTGNLLPQDRRPSAAYRDTILKGARESGIPSDYIKFLETFPHNGYLGEPEIGLALREM
ncbi:gamma-glutamylcyclotransferase [Neodiprion pinetum]|uniref:gamma-glutamylcyclotransferase n=1 Tax=Neodiprion lecontei TaxID=441921 RepID=A0A6J0B7D8_NEOLC|nr:gamma-glutamylcyclotransferase [Neodiprion lecontei]XP_046484189.1 gamma-glutamylcyclotransferase-like [Neodiprion pinetum]